MVENQKKPTIFIVATPIGNLDDITERAKRTLKEVDLIAAEDTREIKKLLSHFGINKKETISYQDYAETKKAPKLLERVKNQNLWLALVSDAGTPCISDPGYRLVHEARKKQIKIVPIPGVSALTTVVSAAGLPCDRFSFVGFLPSGEAALKKEIVSWKKSIGSSIFFESLRRLERVLQAIKKEYPGATLAIGRELTKIFEEIVVLKIDEAISWCQNHAALKGEVTIMVSLGEGDDFQINVNGEEFNRDDLLKEAKLAFQEGASLKSLLQKYRELPINRNELYQLLIKAKDQE